MTDDYLDAILRGELPDDLKTVFQQFRPSVFAAFLTVLTDAMVASYEEMRMRYAPAVDPATLDQDLAGWFRIHMSDSLDAFCSGEPGERARLFGDDDVKAMRKMSAMFWLVIQKTLMAIRSEQPESPG